MNRRQLGEGAFSYVDLIQDCSTGKYFALKRIICHDKKAEDEGITEAKIHGKRRVTHQKYGYCYHFIQGEHYGTDFKK